VEHVVVVVGGGGGSGSGVIIGQRYTSMSW